MAEDAFQWTCPFCGDHQMATNANFQTVYAALAVGTSKYGKTGATLTAARCVNDQCNEIVFAVDFCKATTKNGYPAAGENIQTWRLRPESFSTVQPDYIPAPIREDYYEACLIRDKSPKAAATLARRCLQGMIRDFCKISKNRLIDEIKELRVRLDADHAPRGVEAETIEAIDAIRDIGNIGAHMEKDINFIIDVEPGEAQALIELVEVLFADWYVARHKREQRLANVREIAAEKKLAIENGRAAIAEQMKLAAPAATSVKPE